MEPDIFLTLSCLSLELVSFSRQLLLLGQAQDCTRLRLSDATSETKVREGCLVPGGLEATKHQQNGWFKRWSPGLPPHNHLLALSSVEATGYMQLLST